MHGHQWLNADATSQVLMKARRSRKMQWGGGESYTNDYSIAQE